MNLIDINFPLSKIINTIINKNELSVDQDSLEQTWWCFPFSEAFIITTLMTWT